MVPDLLPTYTLSLLSTINERVVDNPASETTKLPSVSNLIISSILFTANTLLLLSK